MPICFDCVPVPVSLESVGRSHARVARVGVGLGLIYRPNPCEDAAADVAKATDLLQEPVPLLRVSGPANALPGPEARRRAEVHGSET